MTRRLFSCIFFSCLFLTSGSIGQEQATTDIVGTWKLVAMEGADTIFPLAYDHPSGLIVYDPSGWVSVQVAVKRDRKPFAKGLTAGTVEEKAAAFDSYFAYYGTYTLDPAKRTVTHHLVDHSWPGRRGLDNVRRFQFQGSDRLVLIPADDGRGGLIDPNKATYKLIWERVKKQ